MKKYTTATLSDNDKSALRRNMIDGERIFAVFYIPACKDKPVVTCATEAMDTIGEVDFVLDEVLTYCADDGGGMWVVSDITGCLPDKFDDEEWQYSDLVVTVHDPDAYDTWDIGPMSYLKYVALPLRVQGEVEGHFYA